MAKRSGKSPVIWVVWIGLAAAIFDLATAIIQYLKVTM